MMWKREFKRHFIIYFVVSFVALGVFAATRIMFIYADGIQDDNIKTMEGFGVVKFLFIFDIFMSVLIALLSSLTEVFVFKKLIDRHMSIGLKLLFDIVSRSVVIVLVMLTSRNFISSLFTHIGGDVSLKNAEMLPMLVFLAFTVTLCSIITEIDRKLGPGNIWKFLSGKFYKPREEERIFMFVDLKDSTRIAEQLGHLEFSRMLRDCFQDFSVVDNYGAEIYQYVGDEVVISWPLKKGLKKNNFLKAFFAFVMELQKRESYYMKNYGLLPFFKAGVHYGPIVVSEVGDIKREISYHGDTINTTARIQGMCNENKSQLLISEALFDIVEKADHISFVEVGNVQLKGKEKQVKLYKVSAAIIM